MTEIAAVVATILILAVAGFQLALALGAPWGGVAWGGTDEGRLPRRRRIASAISAVALVVVGYLVLAKADVINAAWIPSPGLTIAAWVVVGLLLLNTLANLNSRSRFERVVFGGTTAVLVVLCAYVALTGP